MPGVVGLISKMRCEQAEVQLRQMTEAIRHETFYNSGTWADPDQGVYVGWAARQGSFADSMPLHNEDGEVTLIFSGEEFPEPSVIARLKEHGHTFESTGSSYLAHRYEDECDFPKGLNGRFHGLVADRTRGRVLLFNDRYGLQRLYYHEAKDAVYFASEAKAILEVRPELRTVDRRGLAEFIACGCVLENRSLFSGIHVFPPGAMWTFRTVRLRARALTSIRKNGSSKNLLNLRNIIASSGTFWSEFAAIFQWQGAGRRFPYGWLGYAHHHGVAQGRA